MRLDHLLSKGKSKELNVFYCLAIELKISGGDALRGNTRSHPEHDG